MYNIYVGLTGSFGGAQYIGTIECADQAEADDYAYEQAIYEYESYEGLHGIRSIEDIADENGLDLNDISDYEEAKDLYDTEVDDWIEYYTILMEEDDVEPGDIEYI